MKESERDKWAARLARQADTMLTDAEYAAELGCDRRALAVWRKRLAQPTRTGRSAPPRAALPPTRCANPRCVALFTPSTEAHRYCSPKCRHAVNTAAWHRRVTSGTEATS